MSHRVFVVLCAWAFSCLAATLAMAQPRNDPLLKELGDAISSGNWARGFVMIGQQKCGTEQTGLGPNYYSPGGSIRMGAVVSCKVAGSLSDKRTGGVVGFNLTQVSITASGEACALKCVDGSPCMTVLPDAGGTTIPPNANPLVGKTFATWSFEGNKKGVCARIAAAYEPAKQKFVAILSAEAATKAAQKKKSDDDIAERKRQQEEAQAAQQKKKADDEARLAASTAEAKKLCASETKFTGGPQSVSTYKIGALDEVKRLKGFGGGVICATEVKWVSDAVNPMGGKAARANFHLVSIDQFGATSGALKQEVLERDFPY